MLRTLFVLIIATVGAWFALQSTFNALLLYLWIAYFRPDQWVWGGIVPMLDLSWWVGLYLVVRTTVVGEAIRIDRPVALLLLLLVQSFISMCFSVDIAFSWASWPSFARTVLITCLIVSLVTDLRRLRLVLVTIALSLGFEATKQGWAQLLLNPGAKNFNPVPFLGDDNGVAVGMLMLVPILAVLAQTADQRWWRYLYRFMVIGVLYRAIATYSRGAFLVCFALGAIHLLRSANRTRSLLGIANRGHDHRSGPSRSLLESNGHDHARTRKRWTHRPLAAFTSGESHSTWQPIVRSREWAIMPSTRLTTSMISSKAGMAPNDPSTVPGSGLSPSWAFPGFFLVAASLLAAFRSCSRTRRLARASPELDDLGRYATALEAGLVVALVGGSLVPFQYCEMLWHFIGLSFALEAIARHTERRARVRVRRRGIDCPPPGTESRGCRLMPGLVGAVSRVPDARLGTLFESLLAAMDRGGALRVERLIDPAGRYALARVHLGIFQPEPQLRDGSHPKVLFHGELHNEADLRTLIGRAGSSEEGVAPLIASLYQHFGPSFPARMRGAFCLAVLDESRGLQLLATDLLGSYPLYWFNGPEHFVFASELRALLRDPRVPRELDPCAVADCLTFGFLLGTKTLAAGVALLPPASTLVYESSNGSCSIEPQRRISDLYRPWEGTRSDYLEAARTAFEDAMSRAVAGDHNVGLSLSGGLDSRTILSAVDSKRESISTYTLGLKGCADEKIAAKLSKIAGTRHRFYELDQRYLGEFLSNLEKMVSLTDGMYLTHGLTEMLALRTLAAEDCSILIRGHGGELAKTSLAWPFQTDEHIHAMERKDEFVHYLLERANYLTPGVAPRELFSDEWYDRIEGSARASLEAAVANVPLAPADLCSYLYLVEHNRRFTVPSLELFRNVVEIRLPFLDEEFLEALLRGTARWRDHPDVHRAILMARNPALGRVRNSNTGAPANAGPLVEAVLDKVNTVFRRLGLPGYRHYHEYEAWTRRLLLEQVESVLLQPQSFTTKIFRQDTVRRLFERTRRGEGDHAYLLQVLLILELWQREHFS